MKKRASPRRDDGPTCDTCGNELPGPVSVCPYCRHAVSATTLAFRPRGSPVATCNIKEDGPTVDKMLTRLDGEIGRARANGIRVLRLIHGWGSTGKGGVLGREIRLELARRKLRGHIKSFVPGEEYGERTNAGRELLRKCPELRDELRTDSANPGITLVEF